MKAFFKNLLIPVLIGLAVFCSANNKTKSDDNNALSDTLSVRTYFDKYFEACNSTGCIVIFDNNQKKWIVSDTILSKTEKLPASTFKIINLLIALQTRVTADENETIKWPGEIDTFKYGYRPEIYHDMTVKESVHYQIADGREVQISFTQLGETVKVVETFEAEQIHSFELQKTGWQSILDNFKRHVEK